MEGVDGFWVRDREFATNDGDATWLFTVVEGEGVTDVVEGCIIDEGLEAGGVFFESPTKDTKWKEYFICTDVKEIHLLQQKILIILPT